VEVHNEVNKLLGKPMVTETESINYYLRLGARDRSPFITTVDLEEIDARSMMKGAILGATLVGMAGALLWWSTSGEKSSP
jgi:hypothetical protein